MRHALEPANAIPPVPIDDAVWKANVVTGSDVDVRRLPIPTRAIDKSNPGEPRNVAMGAFTAHVNIKWCIVVDPDVDIYDPADVLWALTTRVDWSEDIFLVPGAQGHEMDPTADVRGVHTKIGVDATFDKGRRDYTGRVRYRDVDLSRYL